MSLIELSEDEKILQEEAIKEIKERKEELIKKFVLDKHPLKLDVISFFMAGSPGSGKTEFSQRYPAKIDKKDKKLIKKLQKNGVEIEDVDVLFVRIDVDEIREFLSQYKKTNIENNIKGNAHVIQKAANNGLNIIRDYCFQQNISFLHDGTFGNFDTMKKMIKKSLKAGREVQIFYLYIDPLSAWKFTKAREFLEGRNIIKEKFIEQFFNSKNNVDKIKQEFKKQVKINCVLKNEDGQIIETEFNVVSVDIFLEKYYTKQVIKKYNQEDLQVLIN